MSSCLEFTTNTASFSPNEPTLLLVKKDGNNVYMTPPPLLSYDTSSVSQGNIRLGGETTVTLTTFASYCGGTSSSAVDDMAGIAGSVETEFYDTIKVELRGQPATVAPTLVFDVNDVRVSVAESNFYNLVRITVTFTSVGASAAMSGAVTSHLQGPVPESHLVGIRLRSFGDTFNYEPEESLGYIFDDPGAQIYRFSRTCSAQEYQFNNAYGNDADYTNIEACSGAKAIVDARMGVGDFKPYYVSNHFRYLQGVNVLNLRYSSSIDLAELSYSVTIDGLYATETAADIIQQSGAFETSSISVQKDASSDITTVTVDGTLKGYSVGASTDPTININAGAGAGSHHVLNRISSDGSWSAGSIAFQRAQSATSTVLNATPKSVSISDNAGDNTITYNVAYDNRRVPRIKYAISENVNVTDTYPTDVYASIQIMGKRDGPVFQYMNTTTHFERDATIEIIMPQNFPGSPAENAETRDTLNTMISELAPGLTTNAGYVMLKQLTENWSGSDGRYTINIGWIYK